MVYTPSAYLVTAAVALVITKMQQTAATSMYYDPEMATNATDEMGSKFPGRGVEMPKEDLAYTVHVDPTLPDITSISSVPVQYPDLLGKASVGPVEPVSTKVGTGVLSRPLPSLDANHDGYIDEMELAAGTLPAVVAKTPLLDLAHGAAKNASDCATGWEKTKQEDEDSKKNRRLEEIHTSRPLTQLANHFGKPMVTKLADLPMEGSKTHAPWPGPYWAMGGDNINVNWTREILMSPSEKYAKAFGLDVKTVQDGVSLSLGIDGAPSKVFCEEASFCTTNYGPDVSCARRAPTTQGFCIANWNGACHAWAPCSIMEEEPRCPVIYNGITFTPLDIKGLLTTLYDESRVPMVLIGTRYYSEPDSKDEYGRHTSPAYRDLNPAMFHIAAANILGIFHHSFVVDKSANGEVWNQPVRGYKIYEQTNMTLEEAAQTFYGLEKYPWNAAAKSIVYIKMRLSWVSESNEEGSMLETPGMLDKYTSGEYYIYLLEIDGDGNIIGGEWLYESNDIHPDFLWFPKAKPALDVVTSSGLSYSDLIMLLEKSIACIGQ
ncbi:unnamed protein product [Hyaloperonospora brassicae]|uniref:EF-hand domain-containing protein n=1 Tax=Hyaloperonospora brassicae TaxID=162125 RepID=A0AAV0UXY5_HYABA|nr:unnamed protein product [Hyaloperonospora brassicae]